jgi:putative component of membrane protein insertase Oxa1/YidC/SpoIIIJ protein YidD
MNVKDKKGRILASENLVLCGMWKSAGYEEVTEKKSSTKKKNSEPKEE